MRPRVRTLAPILLATALVAGCSTPAGGCEPGEGAAMLARFVSEASVATVGEALVADGWNVTEAATELAATRSYLALDPAPERQAVHLSVGKAAGVKGLFLVRLATHVQASGHDAARDALAPVAPEVLALLRPILGEPTELWYEGC